MEKSCSTYLSSGIKIKYWGSSLRLASKKHFNQDVWASMGIRMSSKEKDHSVYLIKKKILKNSKKP